MNSAGRLLVVVILFLFVGQGLAAENPCKQIRFSDVGWADITAATALTSVVLEGLGCRRRQNG
jgi:glycine betaine/proline transport system substrate-binding protein